MSRNNGGFFGTIQHSVNSFFYSLTTNDRYASYDSPYRTRGSQGGLSLSNNNSSVSLVDNSNNGGSSNRSSISNSNRPFQYRPGLRSQLQHNVSGDLQLQDYINGQPPLPSIDSIWERLEVFLEREYPEVFDTLGDPSTVADLNELENDLEISLPTDVRESFQIHDGQERSSAGLIFGLTLLEAEFVVEESTIWKRVSSKLEKQQYAQQKKLSENNNNTINGSPSSSSSHKEVPVGRRPIDFISKQKSIPDGAIQAVYAHPHWIPLAKDNVGNNIAIDLAPGPTGRWGQVIVFGRDFDTKFVVANSWTEFLLSIVEDYEDGKYVVDPENETIYFCENNRPVDYLRVVVHRARAADRKSRQQNKNTKENEAAERSTALRSNNNSRLDLPKESLITPALSTTDLTKAAASEANEHDFKLDDEDDEVEETKETAAHEKAHDVESDANADKDTIVGDEQQTEAVTEKPVSEEKDEVNESVVEEQAEVSEPAVEDKEEVKETVAEENEEVKETAKEEAAEIASEVEEVKTQLEDVAI